MRYGYGFAMAVLVMLVMGMGMIVFQRLVLMFVIVPLRQMQPETERH
jgi:hypothetical protein